MNKILSKEELAQNIKKFVIKAPEIAENRKAGQFVILRLYEKGERFPLTIADSDPATGTITIIVQEIGRSTFEFGRMQIGDEILDLVGPLGKPTDIHQFGRVVCIGGGVGVAEIWPVAKALQAAGNEVISIIGARNRAMLILEEEMRKVSHQLFVTTDDGSYGIPGFVTIPLNQLIQQKMDIAHVFCIGPTLMMKAVAEQTRPFQIKTSVSLNSIMVDGTGMCGACRVNVGGAVRFACVHGPDFDAHAVDFNELLQRQKIYLREEKASL
ncbi:sulfide/dihydroorotate dehydrogenase-like FAD/NAD-binding protein, partial [candidate division KSB1 bacterium]|nr:sulfide/dihydroorotate dehydrogenase-like FAD/NAD-binding protein [candidate division KSB1 bacterium]